MSSSTSELISRYQQNQAPGSKSKTKNLSGTTLCRELHSEQEKKDQTTVRRPAAATQSWKAKHLSGAQLARTEEPFAAKTKTHQGLSRDRLNRDVQSEDQTELTGTSGEQMTHERTQGRLKRNPARRS
jgi:hypothetical protein